jgi:hypothetical protein
VQTSTISTGISFPDTLTHKSNGNVKHDHPPPNDLSSARTVSFRSINYTLGDTQADHRRRKWYPSCIKPEPSKQILHNVSGNFTPGMNAIMGKSLFYSSLLRNISNIWID